MTLKLYHTAINMMPQPRKKQSDGLRYLTGQNTPESNFFCQQNLTQLGFWVENKDNTFTSLKMGKFGKLASVLALSGALAAPLEAQESQGSQLVLANANATTTQVTDCVGFVREQRDLARENNIVMSRADQRAMLLDCRNGNIEARIAEQQQIIQALNEEIAQLNLRIDAQNRILDEHNQEIARIVAINGQLLIRIEQTEDRISAIEADTAAKLAEAERILQLLATS